MIDRPTPTRGATAPLFFDWQSSPKQLFKTWPCFLAWFLAPGSGADTWKRKANAKDRKKN
jgi:hypothetical protein